MPYRGSYTSITRRVDEAARRAERVRAAGPGCAVCAGWGTICLRHPDEPWFGQGPDGGDAIEPWPEPARCPNCHREPEVTIELKYKEPGEVEGHVPDRAALYERLAGEEFEESQTASTVPERGRPRGFD